MTVYVFGNTSSPSDSFPLKLLPKLQEQFPTINFVHADPTENWYKNEKELVILDTVVGIQKPTLFHSLDEFEKQSRITPHDYDVYMDLKLLQKTGKIQKITIIGVPVNSNQKRLYDQFTIIFSKLFS